MRFTKKTTNFLHIFDIVQIWPKPSKFLQIAIYEQLKLNLPIRLLGITLNWNVKTIELTLHKNFSKIYYKHSVNKIWINSLNKLTNSTIKIRGRKRTRLLSSTRWCSKEKDLKNNSLWTSKLTTNLTFQYTHSNSCHPPSVKNGFIKGKVELTPPQIQH